MIQMRRLYSIINWYIKSLSFLHQSYILSFPSPAAVIHSRGAADLYFPVYLENRNALLVAGNKNLINEECIFQIFQEVFRKPLVKIGRFHYNKRSQHREASLFRRERDYDEKRKDSDSDMYSGIIRILLRLRRKRRNHYHWQ